MRTFLLTVLLFTAVACTPAQEENALSVVDGIAIAANTAGAAGIPFGGAVGSLLVLAAGGYKAFRKIGSEKDKNNANYRAIRSVIESTEDLAWMLNTGKIDAKEAGEKLEGLVSGAVQTAHSANGVYQEVRKDLMKLRKKDHNV